jgi:hypothetical protein
MLTKILWCVIEIIIWYLFFYLILFSCRSNTNIGWTALTLVLLGSLGIFASPMTRHLSFWNKILDKTVKKEEENEKY